MHITTDIVTARDILRHWRQQGEAIAFVPTMGNLHAGHMALVDRARRHGRRVVVSIFVNPLQFSQGEDFASYPRTLADDQSGLSQNSVDLLFAPATGEMYPGGLELATQVTVPGLSDILCGAFRPGHFTGVATVVCKLFNIIQPQIALFGEKDYQQLVVIRRMVQDLAMPVEIIGAPTVREPDGLAMSSRNGYLSIEERRLAPHIYQYLLDARAAILAKSSDYAAISQEKMANLRAKGFNPDYFEIRRSADLGLAAPADKELIVLIAARLGRTRLIDNLKVSLGKEPAFT